jgi:hypothetical protein
VRQRSGQCGRSKRFNEFRIPEIRAIECWIAPLHAHGDALVP